MHKKIIWAVDAVSSDKKLQAATLKTLLALTKGSKVTIEPVTVLSSDQLRIPVSIFRRAEKDYRLQVEKDLQKWLLGFKCPELVSPTLLVRDILRESEDADTVLNYAKGAGASLIAVGTHVNRGFKRWFLGSFAETLLIKSDLPTLVVNPTMPSPSRIKRILFPTDFSKGSKEAFEALLPTALQLKAKVILYYKPDYMLPYTAVTLGAVPDYSNYLITDLKECREEGARWAESAKQKGVVAEVVVDKKSGFVDQAILAATKRFKVDLVAMASQSGRLTAAFLGSNARKVVRTSRRPVWVIHPNSNSQSKTASTKESAERSRTTPNRNI